MFCLVFFFKLIHIYALIGVEGLSEFRFIGPDLYKGSDVKTITTNGFDSMLYLKM